MSLIVSFVIFSNYLHFLLFSLLVFSLFFFFFFFQAEDGIRDWSVTGVQTCALPILAARHAGHAQLESRHACLLRDPGASPGLVYPDYRRARLICPPRSAKFHAHYNLRHGIARRSDPRVPAYPGGAGARAPARNVPLPAAHAHAGGAAHGPVPPEQGHWGPVPLARPGRRVGRVGVRARARPQPGRALAPDPQPRLDARDGGAAGRDPAAVHGEGGESHARSGDERPLQRPGARVSGSDLAPGRHDPRDDGYRADAQHAGRGAGGARLYRRWRDLDRDIPRGVELRGRAEGAPGRDRRVQPLGLLHAAPQAIRGAAPRRQGAGLRDPSHESGRQRRAGGVRGDAIRRGARPARRGRPLHRGKDLPTQGARRARRPALRSAGRARALGEGERSSRSLREAAPRQRVGRGAGAEGDRRAGPGGDRRGDRRLRRRAPAGGGYGARRRVRRPAGGAAALVSDSLMADVTYLEALRQGLWEEMERDPRVFILGEEVGVVGGAFTGPGDV